VIVALAAFVTMLAPGYAATFLGTGGFFAAATLALTAMEPADDRQINRFWASCGDASYGMYLWHVPLQVALFVAVTPYVQIADLAKSPWFLLAYLIVVCAVARVMFVLFERPARSWIRNRFSGRRSPASAAVAAP
jgi:peptidoglycan/LPS O-acetylase OafA/YrhL